MKMNPTAAAITALFAASVQAATFVNSYEEGKDKVGEDGFIIVVYPDGWNSKNTALGKAILKSPEFSKAAGNAVLLEHAIPNTTNKEWADARNKRLGPINLPEGTGATLNYPCIYMCEKDGRNYAQINADLFRDSKLSKEKMTKRAIKKAGKEVSTRLAAVKKQRGLIAQAEKASGKQAVDLVYQACSIPGLNRHPKAVEIVKKADPEDKNGLLEVLNHNMYGFIEGCGNANGDNWKAKLEEAEKKMKNPYYSPVIKQTIYTSAFGMLRRHGGAENREKMMRYLKQMRELDPTSLYGQSYAGAMRLWDSWSTPWNPDMIPASNGPMDVPTPTMKDPGVYTVSFNFSRGKHALLASAVELWDGGTKISEDVHECFAGNRHNGHVYTLEVPKRLSNPHIKVITKMGNNRDSNGNINIQQQ